MKNKYSLLIFGACMLGTTYLQAQITLTASSFPGSQIGVDTILNTKNVSAYPNLTPATSAMWDMTDITDTAVKFTIHHVNPDWAEASYSDSNYYNFQGFVDQANAQNKVRSAGFTYYGRHVPRQPYSIAAITGGANDSLIYSYDNDSCYDYSSVSTTANPVIILAFPATYNTKWTNSYHETTRLFLDVARFGYSNAPTNVPFYVTRYDSVSGWGMMQVKNLAGDSTGYVNVLQVQTTVSTIDSFYINGTLAPPTVLAAFGVSQGGVTNSYSQEYYAANHITPIATVNYANNTFTTPVSAATLVSGLPLSAIQYLNGVTNESAVYPNPSNGKFNIQLTYNGKSVMEIYNLLGEKVYSQTLLNTSGNNQVNMGTQPNGVYFYKVLSLNGTLVGKGKIVLNH